MSDEHLLTEQRGSSLWITLNRPEVRNAMTRKMGAGLGHLLAAAEADDTVEIVVITGSPGAFSAGLDRAEIAKGLEGKSEFPVEQMVHFSKPTIAAINGLAYGGGATMAMACDLRVMSESASITFGLGKVGLTPEWGSSYLLWRQIGYSRALDLMLTARRVDASEALALGLVNRVVADDRLTGAAEELCAQICSLPAGTASEIKYVLRAGLDLDFTAARAEEGQALARRSRALRAARTKPDSSS